MKYAVNLGKPFGIRISVHWTFLLIILFVIIANVNQGYNLAQTGLSILFIIFLFICITLHELGHSLTARYYGGEVHSITLLPIGGVANIKKMPEDPKQELVVSAAGLIVNIIIAGIIYLLLSLGGKLNFEQLDFQTITTKNFFILLMFVNLFVVAFNLLPAFPMDGGRMLRSFLAIYMNKLKATYIAKELGQILAVLFVVWGVFTNPFLVIIGIFVYIGARGEYQMMQYHTALSGYTVNEVIVEDYSILHPDDRISKAVEIMLHHRDQEFVVKDNDEIKGILTNRNIIDGLANFGQDAPVQMVMIRDFETVNPDTQLVKAFQTLQQNQYSILPVVEANKIKGIVDMAHINEFILVKNISRQGE
jgi:Zn-dependent protease